MFSSDHEHVSWGVFNLRSAVSQSPFSPSSDSEAEGLIGVSLYF